MAQVSLPEEFYALGYGASTGVTLHAMRIGDDNGPKLIVNWPNPIYPEEGAVFWNMAGLDRIIAQALGLIPKGALVTGYGWGADLIAVNMGGGVVGKPLSYTTFFQEPECPYLDRILERVPKARLFELTGGAPVDRYQLPVHVAWILEHHPGWLLSDETSRLMAVSDYVTKRLSGADGQDRAMQQSEGLWGSGVVHAYCELFGIYGPKLCDLIRPWNPFDLDEVISLRGRIIIPVTHDSGFSRLWGSLFGLLLIWTGSFTGVSAPDLMSRDPDALRRMFEAGICREGAGRLGFLSANVHVWGKIWSALKVLSGLDYKSLANLAHYSRRDGDEIDSHFANAYMAKPEAGVRALLDQCNGDVGRAARGIMESSVSAIVRKANDMAALLDTKIERAVVTGGFAKNRLHNNMLEQRLGSVVVPPFADVATVMGSFVEAICRIEKVEPAVAAKILLPSLEGMLPD